MSIKKFLPTIDAVDCRPTVGRLSSACQPTGFFFTETRDNLKCYAWYFWFKSCYYEFCLHSCLG